MVLHIHNYKIYTTQQPHIRSCAKCFSTPLCFRIQGSAIYTTIRLRVQLYKQPAMYTSTYTTQQPYIRSSAKCCSPALCFRIQFSAVGLLGCVYLLVVHAGCRVAGLVLHIHNYKMYTTQQPYIRSCAKCFSTPLCFRIQGSAIYATIKLRVQLFTQPAMYTTMHTTQQPYICNAAPPPSAFTFRVEG